MTSGDHNRLVGFADQLAGSSSVADDAMPLSARVLENVASYDFSFYEFALPTEQGFRNGAATGFSTPSLEYLDFLQAGGATYAEVTVIASFLQDLEPMVRRSLLYLMPPDLARTWAEGILHSLYRRHADILAELIGLVEDAGVLRDAFLDDIYETIRLRARIDFLSGVFFSWAEWYRNAAPSILTRWRVRLYDALSESRQAVTASYPFEVFPRGSVNIGLRLVRRQEWTPLGIQRGEIVKTIPLGPGQKERVSTRIVRREKRTSTLESRTETDITSETGESTKDSSDIVQEAAETSRWSADAKVSASFFVSAEASTSLGETNEARSKRTNAYLSEVMQKSASRIRRETRVVVNTENETAFESERSSEISNPNSEIAVTYEYHRIQQQYEVFTRLAEVQTVVFVAERLPAPDEIKTDWIRRNDWILAKVLRDESYRETLNELIQEVETEADPLEGIADPYLAMTDAATNRFADFGAAGSSPGQGGLTIPDIYSEPLKALHERLQEQSARDRANAVRDTRRQRLFQHLRDNILHYCHAIWGHEDASQRILRYKKNGLTIPAIWRATSLPNGTFEFTPLRGALPLWQIIDPTGPLGYVGNYAVFGILPLASGTGDAQFGATGTSALEVSLGLVLSSLRARYVGRGGFLVDPARTAASAESLRLRTEQPGLLADPSPALVEDILSYLPELGSLVMNEQGEVVGRSDTTLAGPLSEDQHAEYLYRINSTRRFLVDSNNLYLSLRVGGGAALEPFKRAHRYLDVLKAQEELVTMERRNERRRHLQSQPGEYDPDVAKVIVVRDVDPSEVPWTDTDATPQ
jgi:hypothetical protein